MTKSLVEMDGRTYDVVVIGAGVNGSSAAQQLAAGGYRVLLVDKGDFAAGSSARSSRLLHCGLRYLAPGQSAWEFARHPRQFLTACKMARQAMESRAQFVKTTAERIRRMTFHFPIYDDSPYEGWQVDAAFALLRVLGTGGVPLDYRRMNAETVRETPLIDQLRSMDELKGVSGFREYLFDWPERLVIDNVLDAERMGADVCNYTAVTELEYEDETWHLRLTDMDDGSGQAVTVSTKAIFNMAGIWIDRVNRNSRQGRPKRKITGTKGTHIAVRLPPECEGQGVATLNRQSEPFYCVPWRGLHYFGPTETLYEDELNCIEPTLDEVDWLLDEANYLFPGLKLDRSDVRYAWSGVRPLTYDPERPMGARDRKLHDLTEDGLPNVFAMTAGPVMTHRSAGTEVRSALAKRLRPSGPPQALSYASPAFPGDPESPLVVDGPHPICEADVVRAVRYEHARTLVDVLFRRTGAAWSEGMAADQAPRVAELMAGHLGWSDEETARQLATYRRYLKSQFLFEAPVSTPVES